MKTTKIKPTVHLNGSSRFGLIDQALAVRSAAQALLEALSNATPNGRDYYTQNQEEQPFIQAKKEVESDLGVIKEIMDRWGLVAELIDEQ